ncbi:MAG: hypothetical protein ACI4JM_03390 [Oscillospiraceae bacterium]
MGFFDDVFGKAEKAKDNYEKRQKIAEYNYKAKEYIQSGNEGYENAYADLQIACGQVQGKIQDFVHFKQNVLSEINRELKKVDSAHQDLKLSLQIDFPSWESSGVTVQSWEKLTDFDRIIDTWVAPSVSDFFTDATSDYYEAKSNMNRAKTYRDIMKTKKQELKEARSAVKEIPYFMNDEKSKIEELMKKFKKALSMVKSSSDTEQIDSLKKISELIANSLTTQFLDNNYQVTSQYQAIHNRMGELNNSLEQLDWLKGY